MFILQCISLLCGLLAPNNKIFNKPIFLLPEWVVYSIQEHVQNISHNTTERCGGQCTWNHRLLSSAQQTAISWWFPCWIVHIAVNSAHSTARNHWLLRVNKTSCYLHGSLAVFGFLKGTGTVYKNRLLCTAQKTALLECAIHLDYCYDYPNFIMFTPFDKK